MLKMCRMRALLIAGFVVMAVSVPDVIAISTIVPRLSKAPDMVPQAKPGSLEAILLQAAIQYRIHPALIAAVIEVESGWNPHARSPKGALGLMQLMPDTARRMGVQQPFDMASNILGGVKYLRQMLDLFNDNYLLALAAYNAGPGAVQRYGTIPPFSETIQYLPKVAYWYRHYAAKMQKAYVATTPAPARKRIHPAKPIAQRSIWKIIRDA